MNLDNFLQALGSLRDQILQESGPGNVHDICQRFLEVVGSLLAHEDSDFEEELQGLTSSLDLLATLLSHFPHSHNHVTPLLHRLFGECARKVLGVEFQKLHEDDDQRASFMAAVEALCTPTQEAGVRRLFSALQWTLDNCWAHPTLVSMMKGEEIDEAKALHYLESLELGEVFRLRIELLVESGCDQYALNLCNWCVRSAIYRQDVFVRQTQLLLLHKFGKLQDFYNQCWQVECCTAAQLLQTTFHLAHISYPTPSEDLCWTLECCVGVRMVESLLEDEDKRAVCLTLAQTFLLQDWMQPEKHCCTKELLRLWMHAQRLSESDNEEFLSSVSKVAQITRVPSQLVLLIEVMQAQFGSEFVGFCTELALRSLKIDRHRLDSARVKKEDEEADSAADGLAKTCRQVAQLYQDHNHMCLSSLLTSLYLDPKPDLFYSIEEKMDGSCHKRSPSRVTNVDQAMFKELLDLVEGLRPSVLHPKHGWKEIKKTALFHLENAGYSYDSVKNSFTNLEELLIKKRQMTRKRSKSKTTKQKCFRQYMPPRPVDVKREAMENGGEHGTDLASDDLYTDLQCTQADSLPDNRCVQTSIPESHAYLMQNLLQRVASTGPLQSSMSSPHEQPACQPETTRTSILDATSNNSLNEGTYDSQITRIVETEGHTNTDVEGRSSATEALTAHSQALTCEGQALTCEGQALTAEGPALTAKGPTLSADQTTVNQVETAQVLEMHDQVQNAPSEDLIETCHVKIVKTLANTCETVTYESISAEQDGQVSSHTEVPSEGNTGEDGGQASALTQHTTASAKEDVSDASADTPISSTELVYSTKSGCNKTEEIINSEKENSPYAQGSRAEVGESAVASQWEPSVCESNQVSQSGKEQPAFTPSDATHNCESEAQARMTDEAGSSPPATNEGSSAGTDTQITRPTNEATTDPTIEVKSEMINHIYSEVASEVNTDTMNEVNSEMTLKSSCEVRYNDNEVVSEMTSELSSGVKLESECVMAGEVNMTGEVVGETEVESSSLDYPVPETEVLMTIDEPQKVIVCPADADTMIQARAVLIGDEMTVETEVESSTLPDQTIVQEAVDEVEISTELSPENKSSFNGQYGESPIDSPAPNSAEASDEEEEVLFSCAYCSKPFNSMAQRRRHQEWLCSLKVAKYSCQKCGRTYQSERSLYKHIRVAHRLSVEDVLKNVKLPADLQLKPCSVSLERLGTAILDRYNITIKVKKKKAQPKAVGGSNVTSQDKSDSLKSIKKEKKAVRVTDSPTKRPKRNKIKKEEEILIDGLVMAPEAPEDSEDPEDPGLENGYEEEEVVHQTVMQVPYIETGPLAETYSQLQAQHIIVQPQHTVHHEALPPQYKIITSIQLRQPELLTPQPIPQRPQPVTPIKNVTTHTPGTPRDHSCRYCREKYTNERARLKHERDCVANPHSTEEVVCEFCGGIYKGLLSLNSHLLARHTPDAPKGDKEEHSQNGVVEPSAFDDDTQKRMAPKKKLKLYKNIFVYMIIEIHCGSCDSIFGDKNYCRQHQRKSCSETNGMRKVVKYCCKYCEEAFSTMNNCYQHCLKCDKCPTGDPVKDAETSIYKCTEKECKRAFISQVSLKAHILSVHYIRGNVTNVRFTPGASSKARAKKAASKKAEGATTSNTEQVADNQANFNLAGLSAAEFEQAINMPNVDGFLKLLEDDTLIDSHWDLSEPFQGQQPGGATSQTQEGQETAVTTQVQTVVVTQPVTSQASAGAANLPPLPSWVKTTARTQWNTAPGGSHHHQIGQPQVLQVAQIPQHLKPQLVQAAPGIATARLTAPQAQLHKVKAVFNAQVVSQVAKTPVKPRPRAKPKPGHHSPEPDTPSPSIKEEDEDEEDDTPKKRPHFGGRQPWLVNGKKFMTFRNAPMLRTAIHMCKKCHSKFEDEDEGKDHVEKCGDSKNVLLKTRRFYCVYCDHVSESAKKCREHLIKTCLPAMNIDPTTVLNPRFECKEENCDKQFFVRFFLIKHLVNDHGLDREDLKSKDKDVDDFSLPVELNERLPDYVKECLPLEFTKRRKEGKELVVQQRRKQRKESDSTTYTESSEVSQMSMGSSGQAYLDSTHSLDQLKDEEEQYVMANEPSNTALVTAPMLAQYVQMSTVSDQPGGLVQNVGALLLQCATSEGQQSASTPLTIDTKLPSITRLAQPVRRNSHDLEAIGQAIEQGAHDVTAALQNAQHNDKSRVITRKITAKEAEAILANQVKLTSQQSVWTTRSKAVAPVMSIAGPIPTSLTISNHIHNSTSKPHLALAGQVHLQRGTQPTTLIPPVVMTTHVTSSNVARPQAVRPGQLISPQAPSTPASSQISESVDSESSQSPSPEPIPEPEDGRISPVVDALLARIKAKTKKLEEKNRLKAANKQKMNAAAKRRKRDSSSGSVQSAMSPGASSVSSVRSSLPAPSPGQTPTPPLPQPGSLTAQTIFNHISPPSPEPDKGKTEELRCDECDLAFNTKSLLSYHQKYSCAAKFGSHNKMDDRVCRYCKTTFHHKVALKYHVGKCRSMMLENACSQPSSLSTVEEDSVESVHSRDSTLNSPTPKKKRPLEGLHFDQSRENLMRTLERKAMCHADVNNPTAPRSEWTFKCKYCQQEFDQKLMSLHSHVLASHPDMYKKYRLVNDHSIRLLQNQSSLSMTDLANADDLSLLSLDTSNDLALISDLALLTAEMEASKTTLSKLSSYHRRLVCEFCDNDHPFDKESSLLYHYKCVHGKDIPKLDLHCPQCKTMKFTNDILLHEHMKSKHGIDSLLMPGKLPFNLRQAGHLENQVYHVQGQIFQNQNNQGQGQSDNQGEGQGEQVTGTVDTSQLQDNPVTQSQVVEGQALTSHGQLVSISTDQVTSPLVSSGGLTYTSVPLSTSLAGSAIPVMGLNSISMTVPTTTVTLQTADGQIIHTSVPTSLLQDGGLSALPGAQVLPSGELALPLIAAPGQQLLLQTVASGQVLLSHTASPHSSSPALTASSSQPSPAQPKKKPVKKKRPEDDNGDDKAKKKRSTPAKPRPSPSGTGASFKPELDPEKWKCRYCDMGFPRRQDMRDHIKYTHRVPGAYPGPLPTKSSTMVKDRDDDSDPHEAVLRQGTDILQQALCMIGETTSGETGDSLASTSESGQILAPQVLDIPVTMDFDMVPSMDSSGHQNMTVLPIQQLGLVSASSTIDPSLLLQSGITISTMASGQPTSTMVYSHQETTSMEAEINDVLRQASMAAGIFEDEPGDSSNQDSEDVKPCSYSATEQEEPTDEPSRTEDNGEQNSEDELNTSSDDNQVDTSTEDISGKQIDGHTDSGRGQFKLEQCQAQASENSQAQEGKNSDAQANESGQFQTGDSSEAQACDSSKAQACETSHSQVVHSSEVKTESSPAHTEGEGDSQSSSATQIVTDQNGSDSEPVAQSTPVKERRAASEDSDIGGAIKTEGEESPGNGSRSLRPRKRKTSEDRSEDEKKGRRRSTDSNLSSGASENSAESRGSKPSLGRSRRPSEETRGSAARRVLRNTVKTLPEQEEAKPSRRPSKSK